MTATIGLWLFGAGVFALTIESVGVALAFFAASMYVLA